MRCGKITQNAVQRHSKSPILMQLKSSCATSY